MAQLPPFAVVDISPGNALSRGLHPHRVSPTQEASGWLQAVSDSSNAWHRMHGQGDADTGPTSLCIALGFLETPDRTQDGSVGP